MLARPIPLHPPRPRTNEWITPEEQVPGTVLPEHVTEACSVQPAPEEQIPTAPAAMCPMPQQSMEAQPLSAVCPQRPIAWGSPRGSEGSFSSGTWSEDSIELAIAEGALRLSQEPPPSTCTCFPLARLNDGPNDVLPLTSE